ncbi:MAG TPA: hopanoid biosynthesis associated radical SAM protein HpnJ, partial [Candidatus Angelobacter sp.]|nr:hopanoid biosynthesis associated radical SAM protein HpnJ [Candidatus Angelobacter sp.]
FYDEYYFRPKAVFRIVKKAFFNNSERKRLYKEAKSFMKLRAQRNRTAKAMRAKTAHDAEKPVTAQVAGD